MWRRFCHHHHGCDHHHRCHNHHCRSHDDRCHNHCRSHDHRATTTAAVTTTTAAAVTTTTAAALPAGLPSFSGCAPPGNTLPDGTWAVFIEGIATIAGTTHTTLDLACWFDGAQADVAAAHDGRSTPVEFHPYIRNQNPLVFDVIVAPGAIVKLFGGDVAFASWVASLTPDNGCSAASGYAACIVKVTILGGQAVEFSEPLPEWSGDGRGS